ncbi:hypothetical protein D3C85_174800 [compost metagenome]
MERKAKEFAEAGIEIPDIKGVVLKDSKVNPILTIRENLELDKIGQRVDPEIPIYSEVVSRFRQQGLFDPGRHTLCPELELVTTYLFQHAGHIWKHTHSNFHSIGITGVVELYVPGENAELEYLVQGKTHQYEVAPPGRGSRIAEFVDLTYATSQGMGRNETMAYMIVDRPDHVFDQLLMQSQCESEPEVLTPEDIADREQAMQEASEGKLDYLLEGTQWDPKLRNS